MTISQQKIIKRWEDMVNGDLGFNVQSLAYEYLYLFRQVFENEQTQIEGLKWTINEIRGFSVLYDGFVNCNVVSTLDLNYINIDKEAAKDLDDYLMFDKGWKERYWYVKEI